MHPSTSRLHYTVTSEYHTTHSANVLWTSIPFQRHLACVFYEHPERKVIRVLIFQEGTH